MTMDLSQFFNPAAWGSWNPSPQSTMFPMANTNGVAPTPSGLLGNPFGMRPPNPAPNAMNMPPGPPQMAPGLGTPQGGTPGPPQLASDTTGAQGGDASLAGSINPSGVGLSSSIMDAFRKTMGAPGFAKSANDLSKLMFGANKGMSAPAPPPITMPTPVGPGAMGGMGGGLAGLLSPLLQSGYMPNRMPVQGGAPTFGGFGAQ